MLFSVAGFYCIARTFVSLQIIYQYFNVVFHSYYSKKWRKCPCALLSVCKFLKKFKAMTRNCCLCNYVCEWLDILGF